MLLTWNDFQSILLLHESKENNEEKFEFMLAWTARSGNETYVCFSKHKFIMIQRGRILITAHT